MVVNEAALKKIFKKRWLRREPLTLAADHLKYFAKDMGPKPKITLKMKINESAIGDVIVERGPHIAGWGGASGALAFLAPPIGVPVFATVLALQLIKAKEKYDFRKRYPSSRQIAIKLLSYHQKKGTLTKKELLKTAELLRKQAKKGGIDDTIKLKGK